MTGAGGLDRVSVEQAFQVLSGNGFQSECAAGAQRHLEYGNKIDSRAAYEPTAAVRQETRVQVELGTAQT